IGANTVQVTPVFALHGENDGARGRIIGRSPNVLRADSIPPKLGYDKVSKNVCADFSGHLDFPAKDPQGCRGIGRTTAAAHDKAGRSCQFAGGWKARNRVREKISYKNASAYYVTHISP